jgi:hypothetical protein
MTSDLENIGADLQPQTLTFIESMEWVEIEVKDINIGPRIYARKARK